MHDIKYRVEPQALMKRITTCTNLIVSGTFQLSISYANFVAQAMA